MIAIDRASLIADVSGELTLAHIEEELAATGLTLDLQSGVAPSELSVAEWLAQGAPGAADPWKDPVDHLVAGFDARLPDGRTLHVRPAPRRAVGPDLFALFFGTHGRFGAITRAHLRTHPKGAAPKPETSPFAHNRDPAMNDGERALWDAIEGEMKR